MHFPSSRQKLSSLQFSAMMASDVHLYTPGNVVGRGVAVPYTLAPLDNLLQAHPTVVITSPISILSFFRTPLAYATHNIRQMFYPSLVVWQSWVLMDCMNVWPYREEKNSGKRGVVKGGSAESRKVAFRRMELVRSSPAHTFS
jgi:hypothetical protein